MADGWYLRVYPRSTTKRPVPQTKRALQAKIDKMAEEFKREQNFLQLTKNSHVGPNGRKGKLPAVTDQRATKKNQPNDILVSAAAQKQNQDAEQEPATRPAVPAKIILDENDPMQALMARAMKAAARATAAADTARKIVESKTHFNQLSSLSTLESSSVLQDSIAQSEALPGSPEAAADSIEAVTAAIKDEKVRARLVTTRKINELCAMMRGHTDSATVQHWASLLLYDFVWDEQGRARLADAGGIGLLVAAMGAHAADAKVQKSICSALANLAISDDVRSRLLAEGGLPRIFAALRTHAALPDVVASALRVLLSLAWNPAARRKVRAAGGMEATVQCMTEHADDSEVQEWGARLLGCFAMDSDDRSALGAAGGVERLLAALPVLDPGGPLAARTAAAWSVVAAGLKDRGNQTRILMGPDEQLRLLAGALSPRPAPHWHR